MKKAKNRSEVSLPLAKSDIQLREEIYVSPLDILTVKIKNLRLPDEGSQHFAIKVTFFDQLILSGTIKAIEAREVVKDKTIARGTMNYDPSDYEKMCLFADCPLVVSIQPLLSVESNISSHSYSPQQILSHTSSNKSGCFIKPAADISCCNIDILPIFIDKNKMRVTKRMQPMIRVPLLQRKSWDNLPILTLELSVIRDKMNAHHHKVLKQANYMKISLVASYNMTIPYNDEYIYTAATKLPLHNETNTGLVTFNQGYRVPKRFKSNSFYPKWESLRIGEDHFTKGDVKVNFDLKALQNDDDINLEHYLTEISPDYITVWGSFHRSLMLQHTDRWLWKHLRHYNWPFEVHIYGERGGYSFIAFLNLFNLLYPGVKTVRLAVPLHWVHPESMMEKCGCDLLLTPNDNAPSTPGTTQKPSKATTEAPTSTSMDTVVIRPTGADGGSAFVIVEVKLAHPLKRISIPPYIHETETNSMLKEMEQGPNKRECTGRGQLDRDWQSTVRSAANSLRKVPYYGMTEFCNFNRQLSEIRTRVEILTSCWQDAAVYINNNFVIQEYLSSEETFEEMLMMAHACLMRTACDTLVGTDKRQDLDPIMRAARHARHMQDTSHATELYLQLVSQRPRDADSWRELSTCLQDVNRDWANVCINKSMVLNPRHPLTLLCKGCMVFEEDPSAAEPFFVALLALYPCWCTAWVAASAYYLERELFHMADQIMVYMKKCHTEGLTEELGYPRSWESELGDWWDHTPLLPGMNYYYDAADLLLRIRALTLAEACVAQALCEAGETAAYFHLLALCCRLRGAIDDALCHIQLGIRKFGEISYLRSLEAECHHTQNNIPSAMSSFEQAGSCIGAYSILLSMPSRDPQRARSVLIDLVRRQPSAYAWMALADDWMARAAMGEAGDAGDTGEQGTAKTCAAACAVQALQWDRRAGRAWALLADLVKPSARRLHCLDMATFCGYKTSEDRTEAGSPSIQSLCYRLGTSLRECHCKFCHHMKF